jgi:hypothetical protein
MFIIFTKNNSLGSKLIRWVTGEPVSHVALWFPKIGFIYHSTAAHGTAFTPDKKFFRTSTVIYSTFIKLENLSFISDTYGKPYDFFALLYLGFKIVLKRLGWGDVGENVWNSSGMFICTELITKLVEGEADALITPYQFYLKLLGNSDVDSDP